MSQRPIREPSGGPPRNSWPYKRPASQDPADSSTPSEGDARRHNGQEGDQDGANPPHRPKQEIPNHPSTRPTNPSPHSMTSMSLPPRPTTSRRTHPGVPSRASDPNIATVRALQQEGRTSDPAAQAIKFIRRSAQIARQEHDTDKADAFDLLARLTEWIDNGKYELIRKSLYPAVPEDNRDIYWDRAKFLGGLLELEHDIDRQNSSTDRGSHLTSRRTERTPIAEEDYSDAQTFDYEDDSAENITRNRVHEDEDDDAQYYSANERDAVNESRVERTSRAYQGYPSPRGPASFDPRLSSENMSQSPNYRISKGPLPPGSRPRSGKGSGHYSSGNTDDNSQESLTKASIFGRSKIQPQEQISSKDPRRR